MGSSLREVLYRAGHRDLGGLKCAGRSSMMQIEEKVAEKAAAEMAISKQEQNDIQEIYEKIRRANAKLVGPDGETRILPSKLYSFLLSLLADLIAGHSVT